MCFGIIDLAFCSKLTSHFLLFDYSFESRSILDRHLQDHHAKKLCEMCGDIFNSSITHECLGSPGNVEELAEVCEIFLMRGFLSYEQA